MLTVYNWILCLVPGVDLKSDVVVLILMGMWVKALGTLKSLEILIVRLEMCRGLPN